MRSTRNDQRMATAILYPKNLNPSEEEEIKYDMKEYFFNGPGADCELNSLYLQMW